MVYIAGPFFNAAQIDRIERIELMLERLGFDYFSPRKDTYVKPNSTVEERHVAFKANVDAVLSSEFIIVVTDDKDVGTMFEAGVAYAAGIPIAYIAETLGDRPFNLMLAMSSEIGISRSVDELARMITKATTFQEFEGEIE